MKRKPISGLKKGETMKRFLIIATVIFLFGCIHSGVFLNPNEENIREYSATAITLSDFSMKIVAHYQSQNLSVSNNFDADQFFALLEKIYPDQSRVQSIKDNYKVYVRPVNGGYSVMLCSPKADRKIMEDLSCHLNRVEIRSWENNQDTRCVFEVNWKPFCE